MSIDGDGGRLEGDTHNDVSSLAPDARQLYQLVERGRNGASVIVKQSLRGLDDVFRL